MAPKEIAPEPRPGKSNVRTLTDTTSRDASACMIFDLEFSIGTSSKTLSIFVLACRVCEKHAQ
jgi:hypothetical protein